MDSGEGGHKVLEVLDVQDCSDSNQQLCIRDSAQARQQVPTTRHLAARCWAIKEALRCLRKVSNRFDWPGGPPYSARIALSPARQSCVQVQLLGYDRSSAALPVFLDTATGYGGGSKGQRKSYRKLPNRPPNFRLIFRLIDFQPNPQSLNPKP